MGAGLPILQTIKDLVQTGDEIEKIEGILSGTLSFLFNNYDGKKPFSAILMEAKTRGYTEPDPREDLSGMDFARKIVIVAREAGVPLDLAQVSVQNLVTPELQKLKLPEYLAKMHEQDDFFLNQLNKAVSSKKQIRYIGKIKRGENPSVALMELEESHPFLRLKGSDNIIAIKSKYYSTQPLIIQGPGAGPEVTAGGVFADLLRLATYLGAPT